MVWNVRIIALLYTNTYTDQRSTCDFKVMLKEDSAFSPAQVGYLFTFLARQIAKGL